MKRSNFLMEGLFLLIAIVGVIGFLIDNENMIGISLGAFLGNKIFTFIVEFIKQEKGK